MKEIKYIIGDATSPVGEGKKMVVHCCNDLGGWGKGFVLALSKKWKQPEEKYREWSKDRETFKLGQIQAVKVEKDIAVVNIIGQQGIGFNNNVPPIRYAAIRLGLRKVSQLALKHGASVHAPRIGCGLAGGDWKKVENIIKEELCDRNIDVIIYDLNEEEKKKYG